MVIYNFYITAWYALWIYVILCVAAKLIMDRYRLHRTNKNKQKIELFFSSFHETADEEQSQAILKLSDSNVLFDCICDCYIGFSRSCSEKTKDEMASFMRRIFRRKIKAVSPEDKWTRCLILNNLQRTGVRLIQAEQFIKKCSENSEIEKIIAEELLSDKNTAETECKVG